MRRWDVTIPSIQTTCPWFLSTDEVSKTFQFLMYRPPSSKWERSETLWWPSWSDGPKKCSCHPTCGWAQEGHLQRRELVVPEHRLPWKRAPCHHRGWLTVFAKRDRTRGSGIGQGHWKEVQPVVPWRQWWAVVVQEVEWLLNGTRGSSGQPEYHKKKKEIS